MSLDVKIRFDIGDLQSTQILIDNHHVSATDIDIHLDAKRFPYIRLSGVANPVNVEMSGKVYMSLGNDMYELVKVR